MDAKREVVFVLGASGPDGKRVFQLSREITNKIIDLEKSSHTRYGVIVYNQDAFPAILFQYFPQTSELKQNISKISWPQAGRRYEKGVVKALEMFALHGDPVARRVIILFVNSGTTASREEMKAIKAQLMRTRTRLIVVAIGNDVNDDEIRAMIPNDQDIVRVRSLDNPTQVTKDVTPVIEKGLLHGKFLREVACHSGPFCNFLCI